MVEIDEITRRLDGIDGRLSDISRTLEAVAIQGERLTNLQSQVNELWAKVNTVKENQDRCPIRSLNKVVWVIQVPTTLLVIGVGLKAFGVF